MIAQAKMAAMRARLLSHFGRQAWVRDAQGQHRLCVYKGRDLQPVANDWVEIDAEVTPAVITDIVPRTNAVLRSEAHRAKVLAANVDQVAMVISGAPLFSDELLARMICACAAEQIPGIIVLNKCDLAAETQRAEQQLAPFEHALQLLGWPIVRVAAKPTRPHATGHDDHVPDSQRHPQHLESLRHRLLGNTTLIMGQSGMGKSSLLNALVPGINAQTREISQALQTGKHTTTAGVVVRLSDGQHPSFEPADGHGHEAGYAKAHPHDTWLVDTPGFQLFGLHHLSGTQLALGFPEWSEIHEAHGRCRFNNCTHQQEPGCTIAQAAKNNQAAQRRLDLWRTLISSL